MQVPRAAAAGVAVDVAAAAIGGFDKAVAAHA